MNESEILREREALRSLSKYDYDTLEEDNTVWRELWEWIQSKK
jgi:hypothetical protein